MKQTKRKRCLNPMCTSTAPLTRGLCGSCYLKARTHVIAGRTTWKKLEAQGKVLERNVGHAGRPMTETSLWFIDGKSQRKNEE
jgi:hypothetical protein